MAAAEPKLGLALSGGGHRAAFFHIGVLAGLAELGLLRPVQVISTVSGGSIVGALYYLHVKNLLESKADGEIGDDDYVEVVRGVEHGYREAAATNVRGSGFASLVANRRMASPSYTRTDRVAELYERRFYAQPWGERPRRGGRIAMRDLLIRPAGHDGSFVPDRDNAGRRAPVPILLLEATTLNTGHNWRFEAMYMGEPERQGELQSDVDKNAILARTPWDELPAQCRDFPLGAAVASSAAFPGGFAPMRIAGLYPDLIVELTDGGVHDNQGIEGLLDRGCTHFMISDGSGQMPDRPKPATRIPAVLERVVSIYGDAEREQRLLRALELGKGAFVHLESGLQAYTRAPGKEPVPRERGLTTADFGVDERVQLALAQVRTDLDAFCEVEAWSLMADGRALVATVVPKRPVAELGTALGQREWAFDAVADELSAPSARYLKLLGTAKQQFGKPLLLWPRVVAALVGLVALAALGAAAWGLWLLLVPHGVVLYALGLATLALLVLYFMSANAVSRVVFDSVVPLLLALPLLLVSLVSLVAGRIWLRAGRAARLARHTR
jgi:predicted acylesterase/phospholipase RssA